MEGTHVGLARDDRCRVERRLARVRLDERQVLLLAVRVLVRADGPDLGAGQGRASAEEAREERGREGRARRTFADLSLDDVTK